MKKYLLYLAFGLNIFAIEGSFGIGNVNSLNKYTGEENSMIIPSLNLKYKNIYFRGTELGYSQKKKDTEFGSSFQFSFGGDLKPEDLDNKILETREAPLNLNIFAKQKIFGLGNLELKYQREFQSKGDTVSASYSQRIPLKLPLLFIPYIRYSLRDGDFSNYYLGLRPNEVALWNETYKNINHSSKVDLGFTSNLFLSKKMTLSMVYNKEFLDDKASKIVKEKESDSFIASLLYKF